MIQLPLATNATIKGPVLIYTHPKLVIQYDFESQNGTVNWAEVEFKEVLAYQFHQEACSSFGSNLEPGEAGCYTDSVWLNSLLEKWSQAVGWQPYQESIGGRERFSHFVLRFDDLGIVEVVASGAISKTLPFPAVE